MITRRLVRTLDSRLRVASPLRTALNKIFPDHWTFMFGEIALYSFVVLVLTGVFLALFFDPSSAETTYHGAFTPMDGVTTSGAFSSALELSFDVRAGLLMRQTHHWAALIFVGAIVVHLCRIFFTGAFRRPREINWVIGVTMLVLALVNGFTGYSMPDDQLSGTGLRIIYSVVESLPVVGPWVVFLIFGGEFPAEQTIPRMFTAHVFVVPALLAVLIGLHLLILVRQKHSQFPAPGRTERNVVGSRLWPSYTIRTLGLLAAVLAVLFALGGLAQINPVWIYGPFDPSQSTVPAQPDWYVAWGDGALRLFPPADVHVFGHLIPTQFWPGAGLGGLAFVLLYAWPFLEQWATKDTDAHQLLDRPRDHPVRMAVGFAGLSFFAVLVMAGGDDVIAEWFGLSIEAVVWVLRIAAVAVPLVSAFAAFVLARALQRVQGGFADVTVADVKAALRRTPRTGDAAAGRPRRIEVTPTSGDRWRWRYRESAGETDVVLDSTNDYVTEDAAWAGARTAYPDIDRPSTPSDEETEPATDEKNHRLLTVAGAAVVAAWAIGAVRNRR
ncbi:ubiquinol-cytochrome c reductase cytochrome b subunit [Mycobacterium sp. PSTR-4-N]|uniref:cytochrome bc1 complex cytochrome b subunit n=1 Tax=Mycobacterium sp. PSTR-4-N TaxID=2917745 RepID=UPI001F150BE2|nr:ubiquinol-cytochrome c reductase cytochrome b subunit [Mycobacterium sp. PSTR-4-N]MCG7593755.1 ubiquinol-cytochrome c reductase cytochrome b subunit [Mycobacterium sp. PSTR-4-N]